jgi:hypothetical protein
VAVRAYQVVSGVDDARWYAIGELAAAEPAAAPDRG